MWAFCQVTCTNNNTNGIEINSEIPVLSRRCTFYKIILAQVNLSVSIGINKLYINNFAQKSTKFLRWKVEVFNINENSGKLSNLQQVIKMGSWHAGIDPDTVLDKSWDEDINRHWDLWIQTCQYWDISN